MVVIDAVVLNAASPARRIVVVGEPTEVVGGVVVARRLCAEASGGAG